MVASAPGTKGKGAWWAWLPVLGFGIYELWSGNLGAVLVWTAILGLGLLVQYSSLSRRQRPWGAYALNWSPPVAVAGCGLQRAVVKDYWGVAFFAIIFGFAFVNAAFLEPSPQRTTLFRTLTGLFVVVSMLAVWKTIWP